MKKPPFRRLQFITENIKHLEALKYKSFALILRFNGYFSVLFGDLEKIIGIMSVILR